MISKNYFYKQSRFVLYKILALGGSFFILFTFISFKVYPNLLSMGRAFLDKLETICGCTHHFSFLHHPIIFSTIIFLGLIIAVLFIVAIIRIAKYVWLTRIFIQNNLIYRKITKSSKLKIASKYLNITHKIIELDDQKMTIFCYGFIKPKICISQTIVHELNLKELIAVLAHEKHHLQTYEPLKILLVNSIIKCFFFIPAFKLLAKQYIAFSELSADEEATNGFKEKGPLAGAMYKIMNHKDQFSVENELALSFFTSTTEVRINKLTNNNYFPRIHTIIPILITVFSIVFLFTSFDVLASSSESIIYSHEGCREMTEAMDSECQMLQSVTPVCEMDYLKNNSCQEIHNL